MVERNVKKTDTNKFYNFLIEIYDKVHTFGESRFLENFSLFQTVFLSKAGPCKGLEMDFAAHE